MRAGESWVVSEEALRHVFLGKEEDDIEERTLKIVWIRIFRKEKETSPVV